MGVGLMVGCKGCRQQQKQEVVVEQQPQPIKEKATRLAYTLPSPFEVATIIKQTRAPFKGDLLLPTGMLENFESTAKQALALGIYAADLGYCVLFDQTQLSLRYMSVVKELINRLGISGAVDETVMRRVESNITKRDSVLDIVSEALARADLYLKENELDHISALVLAGGWIEAFYLATSTAVATGSPQLAEHAGEQKVSFRVLKAMLEDFSDKDSFIMALVQDLSEIDSLFSQVEITYSYKPAEVDSARRIVIINTVSKVSIDRQTVEALNRAVSRIRNKITV